ncbi:uncharacterized protein ACBT44_003950 isoform 2-T2 [Syngnathus typhle]
MHVPPSAWRRAVSQDFHAQFSNAGATECVAFSQDFHTRHGDCSRRSYLEADCRTLVTRTRNKHLRGLFSPVLDAANLDHLSNAKRKRGGTRPDPTRRRSPRVASRCDQVATGMRHNLIRGGRTAVASL